MDSDKDRVSSSEEHVAMLQLEREKAALEREKVILEQRRWESKIEKTKLERERLKIDLEKLTLKTETVKLDQIRADRARLKEEEESEDSEGDLKSATTSEEEDEESQEADPETGEKVYTVLIKSLTGNETSLQASPSWTIERIKKLYKDKYGICEDQQRLIYKGAQLRDAETLQSCGYQKGTAIQLILRLAGC